MSFLPEEFTDRIKAQLQDDFAEFLNALESPAPVSIRLNSYKPAMLFEESTKVPWSDFGRYLPRRPSFTLDPSFHAGAYYVQEASSMYLEKIFRHLFRENKPLLVLDLCAAPGGKSTHLLSLLDEQSVLVANEIIPARNQILQENLIRWGDPRVIVTQNRSEDFIKAGLQFDLVLVDAPCSGEGLFRKDPDAVGEWSPDAVEHCISRQQDLLKGIHSIIKPGGTLIYSTCTFETGENEDQVRALLNNGRFEMDLPEEADDGVMVSPFGFRFYPHHIQGEGFFISALRRKENDETEYKFFNDKAKKEHRVIQDDIAFLQKYLKNPENYVPVRHQERLLAFPESLEVYCRKLQAGGLYVRQAGIFIGIQKGKDFIPSHDLSLSTELNNELPSLEFSKDDALRYLRCENTFDKHPDPGWYVIRFQGLALGWMKVLPNRMNNYFPKSKRILMDLK